ncbi:uncharacterized protein [Dermacentor albipictus]|uniref:uncharacterized protein n=1 Tax=Dermacentor albipictus TaxID=60249 RepID=UPI0038FC8D26
MSHVGERGDNSRKKRKETKREQTTGRREIDTHRAVSTTGALHEQQSNSGTQFFVAFLVQDRLVQIMKLLTAILLARLTLCADIQGSYQSGQSKMEKKANVVKMLRQKVPLVLHWIESGAVSLEPYRCIQLLYTSQESDDTLYCVVSNGWTESASRTNLKPGRRNADVSIRFSQTPLDMILNVEEVRNKAAVKYLTGSYVILYAESGCVILRLQNHGPGKRNETCLLEVLLGAVAHCLPKTFFSEIYQASLRPLDPNKPLPDETGYLYQPASPRTWLWYYHYPPYHPDYCQPPPPPPPPPAGVVFVPFDNARPEQDLPAKNEVPDGGNTESLLSRALILGVAFVMFALLMALAVLVVWTTAESADVLAEWSTEPELPLKVPTGPLVRELKLSPLQEKGSFPMAVLAFERRGDVPVRPRPPRSHPLQHRSVSEALTERPVTRPDDMTTAEG